MADKWPSLHTSIIKTERLVLRPLSFDYMPGIFKFKSNPQILHWKKPDTELWQSREWIEKELASRKSWNFVVHYLPAGWRDKAPDASWLKSSRHDQENILGICGVHNAPEIGYAFCPEVWGKGIATEAVQGLIKAYWETFPDGRPAIEVEGENYLEARTHRWNAASENVLRKHGFESWKQTGAESGRDTNGDELTGKTVSVWRLWKPGCVKNNTDSEQAMAATVHDD